MTTLRGIAVLLLALCSGAAHAESERERLATERAAANARLAEQERACAEKFVVTACSDAARKEHRATLARLRRAEMVLDDAARREAAMRRREAIRDRSAAQAARASEAAPEPRRSGPRAAPLPNPPASSRATERPAAPNSAAEQRNKAAFDERVRAAQAHREAVERRNAAREATGKIQAPLPVPSAAR